MFVTSIIIFANPPPPSLSLSPILAVMIWIEFDPFAFVWHCYLSTGHTRSKRDPTWPYILAAGGIGNRMTTFPAAHYLLLNRMLLLSSEHEHFKGMHTNQIQAQRESKIVKYNPATASRLFGHNTGHAKLPF